MNTTRRVASQISYGASIVVAYPIDSRGFSTLSQVVGDVVYNDVKNYKGSVGIKVTQVLHGTDVKVGDTVYRMCVPGDNLLDKVVS